MGVVPPRTWTWFPEILARVAVDPLALEAGAFLSSVLRHAARAGLLTEYQVTREEGHQEEEQEERSAPRPS